MKIYIYIYTNISDCPERGFSYIGISKDPDRRCSNHLNGKFLFANKLRKYDFDFDILDKAESYEEACELEKAYIAELNTMWPNGYNITEGGEGGPHTPETRAKMSKDHLGKKHSPETKQKIGKSQKGRPPTKGMTGKNHSAETRKKMIKSHLGRKKSPEHIAKIVETRRINGSYGRGGWPKGKKRTRESIEKQQVTRRIKKAIRELEKLDVLCFPLI